LVKRDLDKPLVIIEFLVYVGMFKLVMTISTDYYQILGMMTLKRIKMVNFEVWPFISLNKPEIA